MFIDLIGRSDEDDTTHLLTIGMYIHFKLRLINPVVLTHPTELVQSRTVGCASQYATLSHDNSNKTCIRKKPGVCVNMSQYTQTSAVITKHHINRDLLSSISSQIGNRNQCFDSAI